MGKTQTKAVVEECTLAHGGVLDKGHDDDSGGLETRHIGAAKDFGSICPCLCSTTDYQDDQIPVVPLVTNLLSRLLLHDFIRLDLDII